MTVDMWNSVLQALCMGFAFLIPLVACRVADIAFGVVLSSKLDGLKFEWKKLIRGIVYTIITVIGLACLIAGVSITPELLQYYKIEIIDTEFLESTINLIAIISTLVVAAGTYGKDAFEKFKLLLGKGDRQQ